MITVILIVLLVYRINSIKDNGEKKIILFNVVLGLMLAFIFLALFKYEVNYYGGDGTGGSDAYRYWSVIKYLLNNNFTFHENYKIAKTGLIDLGYFHTEGAEGLILYSYLVLKTSPIKSMIFLNITNIILFGNIIVLVYYLVISISQLAKEKLNIKALKYVLFFVSINGGIIEISTDILKETLLLYIFLESMLIMCKYFMRNNKKYIFYYFLLSYFYSLSRRNSFYIFILIFIMFIVTNKKIKNNSINQLKKIYIYTFFSVLVISFILTKVPYIQHFLEITRQITIADLNNTNSANTNSYMANNIDMFDSIYIRFVVGLVRSFFLPTFFRTLISPISYNVFLFDGISNRILELEWQFMYVIQIVISIYGIIKIKAKDKYFYFIILTFSLLEIVTYSFMYFGAVQVRLKLTFLLFLNIFSGYTMINISKKGFNIIVSLIIAWFTLSYIWMSYYLI